MTTIAANLEGMAADKQTTLSDTKFPSPKIVKVRQSIIGAAGDATQCQAFLDWFNDGPEPVELDELCALVLTKYGLYYYECSTVKMPVESGVYAIGSGAQGALALMTKANFNPVQAVEAMQDIDPCTGQGVDYLKI